MRIPSGAIVAIVAMTVTGGAARAQAPETAPAAPAAAPDSAGARPIPKPPAAMSSARAAWLSNRPLLRAGDIVTVILDEQTSARERTSWIASADRGQTANFNLDADGESVVGATGLRTGMQSNQRDQGEANRQGDLTGVLTAQIVSVAENGVARIEGSKKVTIDGRQQQMSLTGSIRLEDVAPSNVIHSSRIADATINYKGKNVSPKRGILGKILGIIWP
jgi:flagellar L-ring protein precursor FlgH